MSERSSGSKGGSWARLWAALLVVYVVGGAVASLPFTLAAEARHPIALFVCFPDFRPYWGAAFAVCAALTFAVRRRSMTLAILSSAAACTTAIAAWYCHAILWNTEWASIARSDGALEGQQRWLVAWWMGAVGVLIIAGGAVALLYALALIRAAERDA